MVRNYQNLIILNWVHSNIFEFLSIKVLNFALSNEIFYCNFDQSTSLTSQCGGSIGQAGSGTSTPTIVTNEAITIGALVTSITDVKSISTWIHLIFTLCD